MAEQKAAVEVKQEGDFKIKSKPKKPKNLGAKNDKPVKMDFTKPEAQGEVTPDVVKMDLTKKEDNAVQERKTEEIPVGKRTGDSKGVDGEIRIESGEKEVVSQADSDTPITEIIEEVVEKTTPEVKEIEQPQEEYKLPENVDKLVKFMDETGGTVEDYVKLNKDYTGLDDDTLLKEYYKQSKPHLSQDEINFLIEDKFQVDEELDTEKETRRKKLAYKEEVATAKTNLERLKTQYYADIKKRPGTNPEQQKALEFFNRYNKQQETVKSNQDHFKTQTKDLFANDFKGFEYSLGEKKFRYKVQDPGATAEKQNNIDNFISKYVDKDGKIIDAQGYHKALHAAMNADKLASHFYEQGKADGIKDVVKNSKNPASEAPRQVAGGDVFVGGLKVKSISGADSSKLKIRRRTFNN